MIAASCVAAPTRHSPRPTLQPHSAPRARASRSTAAAPQRPACLLEPRPLRAVAAMVQYLESERSGAKGHKLFTVTFLPDPAAGPPTAVLCWHHGIAEHIGRYRQIFTRFADAGVAVYSGDIVGHGKSEGHRALVESYQAAADEFLALAAHAREDIATRYPGASPPPPFFIGGHSLGGLIAALACLKDQGRWAGMMLCSPALDVQMSLSLRIQAAIGSVLAAIVPRARLVAAVDPKDMNPDPQRVQETLNDPLITDPKRVEEYLADPLNTVGNLPVRTANEIVKAMGWLRRRWGDFTLPVYVHHGAADKCTSPPASEAFVTAVASQDKVLHLVPGGYHEVLFSPGVEWLEKEMITWITLHAAAGEGGIPGGNGASASGTSGGSGGGVGAVGAAAKM